MSIEDISLKDWETIFENVKNYQGKCTLKELDDNDDCKCILGVYSQVNNIKNEYDEIEKHLRDINKLGSDYAKNSLLVVRIFLVWDEWFQNNFKKPVDFQTVFPQFKEYILKGFDNAE